MSGEKISVIAAVIENYIMLIEKQEAAIQDMGEATKYVQYMSSARTALDWRKPLSQLDETNVKQTNRRFQLTVLQFWVARSKPRFLGLSFQQPWYATETISGIAKSIEQLKSQDRAQQY